MRTTTHNRREHGVALLLTILGLLLLTAVAAAMLFSSNTETAIAVNYRDKQVATYAALSGLQEARARLHPLRGDLNGFPLPLGTGAAGQGPAPTNLPGPSNGQVLYVINPDPSMGETAASIAPWKANISAGVPNPYFDKELCQEGNMSTLGVTVKPPGSPCTAAPSNSCTLVSAGSSAASGGWCSYYDNSASSNATFNGSPLSWQLKNSNGNLIPLPYKWVRITLKADNSAPVWVQTPGSPATGLNQVCWDNNPNQQIQRPSTAGVNCLGASTYSVGAVYVNNPGAGYSTSTPPTVTFQGGGGTGATATLTLASSTGAITSTTQNAMGSGYTSPPSVSITPAGATFQALVSGSPVTALSMGTTNYCYPVGTSNLQVSFNPNPPPTQGGTATASVTMGSTHTCVASATATASCGNSLKNTLLTLSYSGFSGTVTTSPSGKLNGSTVAVSNVGSFGSGVPASASVTSSPACSGGVTVNFTAGIQISSLALTNGGGEYITAPTASLSGTSPKAPNAAQPAVNVTWSAGANNGKVTAVNITNGGSGYAAGSYPLTLSGGGGSGASYTASSLGTNSYVSGITVASGGSGYVTPPQVIISGAPGSGATATAALTGGQQLYLGPVYTLTSLAVTRNGARAMAQMEVGVTPPTKFQLGGALTIAGSNPVFSSPQSAGFAINGTDHAGSGPEPPTCNGTPGVALPSIGVADSIAQSCIANGFYLDSNNQQQPCNGGTTQNPLPNTSGLGKPDNYIGVSGTAPDVQVVPGANPDPSQLQQVVLDIYNQAGTNLVGSPLLGAGACTNTATHSCGSFTQASLPSSTATNLQTTVVNGDLTISGSTSGYGVLVVTGNLIFNGNFTWHGLVLVIGTATTTENGGGNGQITGSFYVGNTAGTPANMNWNGGGGNGINYDHCWADDLLSRFPPSTSDSPLQVLSTRMLEY